MLNYMNQVEFIQFYHDIQEKLVLGRTLSAQERVALLLGMILVKPTRKENKYGQV